MYSTACHKYDHELKDKQQQAAQTQPTEAQKISPTLKLQLVGIHNLKKRKLNMNFSTVPDDVSIGYRI